MTDEQARMRETIARLVSLMMRQLTPEERVGFIWELHENYCSQCGHEYDVVCYCQTASTEAR